MGLRRGFRQVSLIILHVTFLGKHRSSDRRKDLYSYLKCLSLTLQPVGMILALKFFINHQIISILRE